MHLTIYANNKIIYNDTVANHINNSVHNKEIEQSFKIPITDTDMVIQISTDTNYNLNDIIAKAVFYFQ